MKDPGHQHKMSWKENAFPITVMRIKSIEYDPVIVGELDKYSGELIPPEKFDISKPPNPVYSLRGEPMGTRGGATW